MKGAWLLSAIFDLMAVSFLTQFTAVPKSRVFVTLHPPENHLCVPDSSITRHVSFQCVYYFKMISVAHFMNAGLVKRRRFR